MTAVPALRLYWQQTGHPLEKMLFRQFLDPDSSTFTYLIAASPGRECLIVDPVRQQVGEYLRAVEELGLTLVAALDTHVHADHITALGALADATGCTPRLSAAAGVEGAVPFHDGEEVGLAGVSMRALATPGHTDDSFCFLMDDRVLTGDTLLIRGTGRTDFQNGDSFAAWESLQTLLALPDDTLVYPAHDYKGWTVSTIGEERRHNPRLQVSTAGAYADIMAGLDLPRPGRIDVALPANRKLGRD
ncbi:MAG: MBL fold metallo-hydrolase [Gammaproteobacteria bacterium]|nr:MBL fold metallo-hydrolase [Gammaproteobacteria bacterium]